MKHVKFEDVIDLRDWLSRYEALDLPREDLSDEEAEERAELAEVLGEILNDIGGGDMAGLEDFARNESALIKQEYFPTYMQQWAQDLGYDASKAPWPTNHINWDAAAEERMPDYLTVRIQGHDYVIRSA